MISTNTFVNLVDPNKNTVIAYSGGGDSSALLHFCYELKQKNILLGNLSAIHINHSLNNEAEAWEKHCKNFCKERKSQITNYYYYTLQKKEVFAQLFDLAKHFKICYVYVKRKPM